jgi:hypothetical protein
MKRINQSINFSSNIYVYVGYYSLSFFFDIMKLNNNDSDSGSRRHHLENFLFIFATTSS